MRPVYIDVAGRRLPVPVAAGLRAAAHNRSSLTQTPSDHDHDDDGDDDDEYGDDYDEDDDSMGHVLTTYRHQ